MKEPWKKTCNGKVIITLNDEKTAPTEVEVPVDLNWTNRNDKKCSAPKAIILVGVVLMLGLTVVTLFKVQNLVYLTSYINWHTQQLQSTVSDSNDDVKLIKYKMSLDERAEEIASARAARAEPLIASIGNAKHIEPQIDNQDLKLSESQNQNHKLTNSLNSEPEAKKSKEVEVQSSEKNIENLAVDEKVPSTEFKNAKDSEVTELNDARDHPNPADPEEWIKPLVETFDIFGNQPIEDHFIQNVLMKLLMPENNFEVLELNKMQEASNAAAQEAEKQKTALTPFLRNNIDKLNKPLPLPIESILMKTLLQPVSNFKIFHFNEKPEQLQQQNSMEEEMSHKMASQNIKIKQMLPPIEGIVKSFLPPNMKIFQFNDKQEQNIEEDMPKITIQSIKLKMFPPQEDFSVRRDVPENSNINNNFEVIRLNESPEPSHEVEAPKMPMPLSNFNPFPIPIQDILLKTIIPASKNIEIIPLNEKPEEHQHMQPLHLHQPQPHQDGDMDMNQSDRFNPLPIPIQDIVMKTLIPPLNQNQENHYGDESQEQQNHQVEVTKIPVRTMKVSTFPLPIPEALMKSFIPVNNYGESMINLNDNHEEAQQQHLQQLQPQQQQTMQPQEPSQITPLQEPQEAPRVMARSTKLNPIDVPWNMVSPSQNPIESVQN